MYRCRYSHNFMGVKSPAAHQTFSILASKTKLFLYFILGACSRNYQLHRKLYNYHVQHLYKLFIKRILESLLECAILFVRL